MHNRIKSFLQCFKPTNNIPRAPPSPFYSPSSLVANKKTYKALNHHHQASSTRHYFPRNRNTLQLSLSPHLLLPPSTSQHPLIHLPPASSMHPPPKCYSVARFSILSFLPITFPLPLHCPNYFPLSPPSPPHSSHHLPPAAAGPGQEDVSSVSFCAGRYRSLWWQKPSPSLWSSPWRKDNASIFRRQN